MSPLLDLILLSRVRMRHFILAAIFGVIMIRAAGAQPIERTLSLPMNPSQAVDDWELSDDFEVVDDELLGRPVLEHKPTAYGWIATRAGISGPVEIVAKVRIVGDDGVRIASLNYGAEGHPRNPDAAYSLQAYVNLRTDNRSIRIYPLIGNGRSRGYMNETHLLGDNASRVRNAGPTYFRPRYRDISPVWDIDFRKEIEASAAAVPGVNDQYFELRIVHTDNYIRMYRDGYLLAERIPAGDVGDGVVHLQLRYAMRIASFEIRPVKNETPGYEVIDLAGYANASLADQASGLPIDVTSLPERGKLVNLAGIPMRLPSGERGRDHIDLEPSLFHYRNQQGHYMANVTWPAPTELDPARIRLAIPNRPYSRMWVLAASDGRDGSVPMFTARFYRHGAGFTFDAEAKVPTLGGEAEPTIKPVPVKLSNGDNANLWLIPLDFDPTALASEMREQPYMSLELTKKVLPYRTYPDPANYNWFQGGLPSGVHILAMTLEHAPVQLISSGNRDGNVYVSPEEPVWQVKLSSLTDKQADADIKLTITSPDGVNQTISRKAIIPARGYVTADIPIDTATFGLHHIATEVTLSGAVENVFKQVGTFVQLPVDRRIASRANTHWGLWTWVGTHGTNPDIEENMYLNLAAGAHFQGTRKQRVDRRTWDISTPPKHIMYGPAPYSLEDEIDPAKREAFKEETGKKVAKMLEEDPTIPSFSIFTETAISPAITYGIPPEYTGESEEELWDDAAKKRFDAMWETAMAACEGIREHAPEAKIALGWCEAAFTVPFMKRGFPAELFDMIGIDTPVFERTPEMPVREIAANRVWMLKQAMHRYGYEDKPVIHTESYYPSSHELALGHRGSANHMVRLAVLSLALESDILANCFTLHDCSNYWGSQHYGCIGLIGRAPEWNPKVAYPAFATMTTMIDREQYDGFIPTGSMTTYCVRFKSGGRYTYCLWTVRGERDINVTFAADNGPLLITESGVQKPLTLKENTAELTVTETPVWIRTDRAIQSVEVGKARYPEAEPGYITELPDPYVRPLDSLEKPWNYKPGKYESYDENHWAAPRFPGPVSMEVVESKERGQNVWQLDMAKPDVERPLVAWYGVFEPERPVAIPGRARAVGVWANGSSNWGRIVYEIVDAKGETWQSVGKKDDWNCDDIHTWSYFNFDGWRYLEFPLPSHEPGDNYRDHDTVWWNFDGDGVVDLPVSLSKIIVEARTHHVYVDELQEITDRSVQLSDLIAVYESADDATDTPVNLQNESRDIKLYTPAPADALPNPFAELQEAEGAPEAPKVTRLAPPEHFYDGTRIEFTMEPVESATQYRVYASAYEDGRSATVLARGDEPTLLVRRLRPEMPIYLFGTYVDDKRQESKPSEVKRVLLSDDFPMK